MHQLKASINTLAMSQYQDPVMSVKVIYNSNRLEMEALKKSRQLKRNYLKPTQTASTRFFYNTYLNQGGSNSTLAATATASNFMNLKK